MIPPEISRHLSDELRLRLEPRAQELRTQLERLGARARAANAPSEDVALAVGVLLALASPREEAT